MPDIKHNFTGGKMNKDLDERLVPNGEYRDAMNIQVQTSEGSEVGTIQNILGNNFGCDYNDVAWTNPIPSGATTVGSVSDEKNDSLYWLVAGPNPIGTVSYPFSSSVSFKDMVMRTNKSTTTGCEPVFVDLWKYCAEVSPLPGVHDNSLTLTDSDGYDVVVPGMHATGYGPTGSIEFGPTLVTGSGNYNLIPMNYTVGGDLVSVTHTPPTIQIGDVTNTNLFLRGFWNDNGGAAGTGGYTDIHYYDTSPQANYPSSQPAQSNLPPNGAAQFWIPAADLTSAQVQHLVTPDPSGTLPTIGYLPNILSQAYSTHNGGKSILNGIGSIAYDDVVAGQIYDHNGVAINAYIMTINNAFGKVYHCWSEQNGTQHSQYPTACPGWYTGIWQKNGSISLGSQNGEAYPFYELEANIVPNDAISSTSIPNSTVEINDPQSQSVLDEIFNILFDFDGVNSYPPTVDATGLPVQLQVNSSLFPPNSCIDPNSVIDPANGFNLGPPMTFSNIFTVMDCDTGAPNVASGFNVNQEWLVLSTAIANGVMKVWLQDKVDLSLADSVCFEADKTLNFNPNKLITGINIIDDMLFWTDGYHDAANKLQGTEPKKINIKRSIQGTDISGIVHTDLYVDGVNEGPAREEHITVIRKAPLGPPTLEMTDQIREGILGGPDVLLSNANSPFQTPFVDKVEGESLWVVVDSINGVHPNFDIGDILRIQAVLSGSDFDLPNNYHLRLEVVAKEPGPFSDSAGTVNATIDQTAYLVRILTIANDSTAGSGAEWYTVLEEGDSLFERKFPRFAYRYKYVDNEYSSFGPFSEVAFIPGYFDYAPIEAYNIGMTNRVKSLIIKDFVSNDTPKDVVQVDILYKNETSPTVYLLDSVSRDESTNNWNTSSYEVSTESVFGALPTSQTLRSWDNVPKTARAQEITGNRLVYGNYLQGYDVKQNQNTSTLLQPSITTSLASRIVDSLDYTGKQSIKSLRTYDVGVVWGDKYGRETPVITSTGSSLTVPKSKSLDSSYLVADINASPHWADYYRFYVKETSNEYYNLPVDRVYDAEDGNIWVSFPSVDRNKVDKDTYIVLKKGIDSDKPIIEDARYKIVAIENEAPEYIKTTYERLVRSNTDDSRYPHSCYMYGGSIINAWPDPCVFSSGDNHPEPGRKGFSLSVARWSGDYSTSPSSEAMGLTSPEKLFTEVTENSGGSTTDELFVSFSKEITDGTGTTVTNSRKYHVVEVKTNTIDGVPTTYYVSLSSQITVDDSWVAPYKNPCTTANGCTQQEHGVFDNIHIHFWKKTIRNKPEFDGRFFVKILNNSIANSNLKSTVGMIRNFSISASADLYKIEDPLLVSPAGTNLDFDFTTSASAYTRTSSEWNSRLKFGGSSATGNWFIDKACFASQVPSNVAAFPSNDDDFIINFWNGTNSIKSLDNTSDLTDTFTAWCGAVLQYNTATSTLPVGNGHSLGTVGMKGVHSSGGVEYFDLGYSKLEEGYSGLGSSAGHPYVHDHFNPEEFGEVGIVTALKPNTRFKLKGSEVIYKILSVQKFRLFNYQGRIIAKSWCGGGWDCGSGTTSVNNYLCTGVQSSVHYPDQTYRWEDQRNRRATYRIAYEVDTASSPDGTTVTRIDDTEYASDGVTVITPYNSITNDDSVGIDFLEEFTVEGENPISSNPAIFETEPKEDVDLDLYYEASSSLPAFPITERNKHSYIPIGVTIVPPPTGSLPVIFPEGVFVTSWNYIDPSSPQYIIKLSTPLTTSQINFLQSQGRLVLLKDNGELVQADIVGPANFISTDVFGGIEITPKSSIGLSWFNCWSFNNGVESNRVGDTFNKPFLTNGATVSTTTEERFKEEHRKYGLIYSGLYNSNSSVNSLNQFIQAEKITKDINPTYGSIQKLHSGWGQGGDLVTLCEDRILKILANKDALFNADGNSNVTSTNNVLGQTIPYSGEFGISQNPESFASDAYRAYFTDKVRGTVMRLSMDGLTPISEHGMKDWFRDNLKSTTYSALALGGKIIGSYDDRQDEYNVNIVGGSGGVVSFSERVKGWVSFKSFFQMEDGISCANNYYTFYDGNLYKHHDETVDRNTFYPYESSPGVVVVGNYTDSSFTVLINELPGSVKTFHTLNYEGSQSKIDQLVTSTGTIGAYDTFIPGTSVVDTTYNSSEYYNLSGDDGWYVQSIKTDLEEGSLNEFIEKEGKWFNYIKGTPGSITDGANIDGFGSSDISFQGIGRLQFNPTTSSTEGCTDPTAFNYDENAIIDDASCVAVVYGCTNNAAPNYDPLANTDDGSCIILGCIDNDPTTNGGVALNYDSNATVDDGSCTYSTYGCTLNYATPILNPSTPGLFYPVYVNYDASADIACDDTLSVPAPQNPACVNSVLGVMQDGPNCCCVGIYFGCMDPTATNFDALANTQPDATYCTYAPINGCMDTFACNYDNNADTDDGSCVYCGDTASNVDNFDNADPSCIAQCLYCDDIADLTVDTTMSITTSTIPVVWSETFGYPQAAGVDFYKLRYREVSCTSGGACWTVINNIQPNVSMGTVSHLMTGLADNTEYVIQVKTMCYNSTSSWSTTLSANTAINLVQGCLDNTGAGNPEFDYAGNPATWGACNYDPAANADASNVYMGNDYSNCDYTSCTGCMDVTYQEFCSDCWDTVTQQAVSGGGDSGWYGQLAGNCVNQWIYGCMDATMFGFDPTATIDDGSCTAFVYGCTDNTTLDYSGNLAATNYDCATAINPGSSSPCTDGVNTDDGSCAYEFDLSGSWVPYDDPTVNGAYTDGWVFVLDAPSIPTGLSPFQLSMYIGGNNAAGYNVSTASTIESQLQTNLTADLISVSNASLLASGNGTVWDSLAALGWVLPTIGTHVENLVDAITVTQGCMDDTMCNYDSTANAQGVGDCEPPYGCGDPLAMNYDPATLVYPSCPEPNNAGCSWCEDPNQSDINAWTVTWDSTNNMYMVDRAYDPSDDNGSYVMQATNSWAQTHSIADFQWKYKPAGGSWTAWQDYGNGYTNNCGESLPTAYNVNGANPLPLAGITWPTPNAAGDKVKFRIKNRCEVNCGVGCTNCSQSGWTATQTIELL